MGWLGQAGGKLRAVKRRGIAIKFGLGDAPYRPARMLHSIFHAAALFLRRVAPVMFGDKFFQRTGSGHLRFARGLRLQVIPALIELQGVFRPRRRMSRTHLQMVAHGQRDVVLVVTNPRYRGDGGFRDNLLDEDHAATPFLAGEAPNVKSQIQFFKFLVERDGHPQHFCLQEQKTHDAGVGRALVFVEHRAGGHERLEDLARARVIEQHQVTPLSGEEGFGVAVIHVRAGRNYTRRQKTRRVRARGLQEFVGRVP